MYNIYCVKNEYLQRFGCSLAKQLSIEENILKTPSDF